MPMSHGRVEQGEIQETNDSLIEEFLEKRREVAFTNVEIAFGIFNQEEIADFTRKYNATWVVQNSLDNLVKENRVNLSL